MVSFKQNRIPKPQSIGQNQLSSMRTSEASRRAAGVQCRVRGYDGNCDISCTYVICNFANAGLSKRQYTCILYTTLPQKCSPGLKVHAQDNSKPATGHFFNLPICIVTQLLITKEWMSEHQVVWHEEMNKLMKSFGQFVRKSQVKKPLQKCLLLC